MYDPFSRISIARSPLRLAFRCVLVVLYAAPLLAHDGLHEQIEAATREIELFPKDSHARVLRAELFRQHRHWGLAFQDLESAAKLRQPAPELEFVRGKLLRDLDRHKPARKALDKFLDEQSDHVAALQVRAEVFEALGEFRLATRDWTRAIRHSKQPTPDQYVGRANCVAQRGEAFINEALLGLGEGLTKLGPVVSLQLCALEIEVSAGRFDGAITRLDDLISTSERSDQWLAKKGDVLVQAKRLSAAKAAYEAALRVISHLNPKRRNTPSTLDRIRHLRTQLEELARD